MIREEYEIALINVQKSPSELITDVFIVDQLTHVSELPEDRDKQGSCSENRLWKLSLWLQDMVGHY